MQQLITLENDACNASIVVHSDVRCYQFVPSDGVYEFIEDKNGNDNYVDLTGDRYIYMDHPWTIDVNFSIEITGYNLQDKVINTYIQRKDNDDYIKVWYDREKQLILAEKKVGKYILPFRSVNKIMFPYNSNFTILITNINGRLGLFGLSDNNKIREYTLGKIREMVLGQIREYTLG